MTEPCRAVFLSYASGDALAARQICDALRSAGVEVWFDQSELRGGDVWDRQIRKNIHDCALFIPIISSTSQARLEGYFRREWKLAVDRTHDMADGKPFLVPVVIDDTNDQEAEVPESFRSVQWTRLPGGATPQAFVELVLRLLLPGQARASIMTRPSITASRVATPFGDHSRASWRSQSVVLAITALAVIAVGYLVIHRFVLSKRAAERVPASASILQSTAPVQSTIPEKSIAVLPFVDMSEKKDQEYFSDGLSEELIDLLTKVPELRVPARTSSFFFKGKSEEIGIIAQQLHVAHVLEGSVRKAGTTIRVTAELVRADNGYHLWSETYDRELKDIFKVQDEIAGAVVAALKLKLAPGQQATSSHRTSNPDAYNQYLLGRQFFEGFTVEGFGRAVDAFRKAIQLDPNYAAAYAELAVSQYFVADETGDTAQKEQALATAEKAVALAPDAADDYAVRGYLRCQFVRDWTGAQSDFAKALALNPGDNRIQRRYAQLLASLGRLPESVAVLKKATEMDPLSSLTWAVLGNYLIADRQFAAAEEAARRALEIQPDSRFALGDLGIIQLLKGNPTEALTIFGKRGGTGFSFVGIAMAEHSLGHVKESQHALDEAIAKHAQDFAFGIAEVYAWRGQKDRAFAWLERAFQQHDGSLSDIKNDPLLASLRGDARYGALLKKMHLSG